MEDKQEEVTNNEETRQTTYRLDISIERDDTNSKYVTRSAYVHVTGIPKDLPEQYEHSIKYAAEAQFANALNQRTFLEVYPEGKTVKDAKPVFYNLSTVKSISIINVAKVE